MGQTVSFTRCTAQSSNYCGHLGLTSRPDWHHKHPALQKKKKKKVLKDQPYERNLHYFD